MPAFFWYYLAGDIVPGGGTTIITEPEIPVEVDQGHSITWTHNGSQVQIGWRNVCIDWEGYG